MMTTGNRWRTAVSGFGQTHAEAAVTDDGHRGAVRLGEAAGEGKGKPQPIVANTPR